jgi:hypothetical protein
VRQKPPEAGRTLWVIELDAALPAKAPCDPASGSNRSFVGEGHSRSLVDSYPIDEWRYNIDTAGRL